MREIRAELQRLDEDAPSALGWFVKELVELVGAESGFALRLTQTRSKLTVQELIGHRVPLSRMRASFESLFADQPLGWTDWNHLRPEPSQRNRPVSAVAMLGWEAIERVPAYQRVLVPNGLAKYDNLRVLVCNGPVLLAWVGALREEPFTGRELALYDALVPALRDRLALERQLSVESLPSSDFAAALESISAPAFLLSAEAEILHANAAGCAVLAEKPDDVSDELWASVLGAHDTFSISPIDARGMPAHYLAVQRLPTPDVAARLGALRQKGALRAREVEVLRLLAHGLPDTAVATTLGCSRERVERDVAALMQRFDCQTRAALVARVLSPKR